MGGAREGRQRQGKRSALLLPAPPTPPLWGAHTVSTKLSRHMDTHLTPTRVDRKQRSPGWTHAPTTHRVMAAWLLALVFENTASATHDSTRYVFIMQTNPMHIRQIRT